MKRWFLTVDRCDTGKRGVFCSDTGKAFGQDTQHTQAKMNDILGPFALIMAPQSISMTEQELKEYHRFFAFEEYSHRYGVVVKEAK